MNEKFQANFDAISRDILLSMVAVNQNHYYEVGQFFTDIVVKSLGEVPPAAHFKILKSSIQGDNLPDGHAP